MLAALVIPTSFVARFAPELWLTPVFVLAGALLAVRSGWWRWLTVLALVALLANGVGAGISAARWQVSDGRRLRTSLESLRSLTMPLDTQFTTWKTPMRARLVDAGIRMHVVDHVDCPFLVGLWPDGSLVFARLRSPDNPPGSVLFCTPGTTATATPATPATVPMTAHRG